MKYKVSFLCHRDYNRGISKRYVKETLLKVPEHKMLFTDYISDIEKRQVPKKYLHSSGGGFWGKITRRKPFTIMEDGDWQETVYNIKVKKVKEKSESRYSYFRIHFSVDATPREIHLIVKHLKEWWCRDISYTCKGANEA